MKKFWRTREVGTVRAVHPFTRAEITVNPQRDAMISEDLDTELRNLPGLVAWYCSLRDTAETLYREARHREHNVEEDLYAEVRSQPVPKGGKRPTETEMKMLVKRDTRMRDAYRERMNAEEMLRNLRSAVEALDQKRWALMSLTKWRLRERVSDSD